MKGEVPKKESEFPIPPPSQESKFESTQATSEHTTHVLNQLNAHEKATETGWRFAIAHSPESERPLISVGYEPVEGAIAEKLGLRLVGKERLLKIPYERFQANQARNMALAKARNAPIAKRAVGADDKGDVVSGLTETIQARTVSLSVPDAAKAAG